ncbi:MAG: hypothetical protein ACTSPW_19965, partial [Promethearchaeota archaeon]
NTCSCLSLGKDSIILVIVINVAERIVYSFHFDLDFYFKIFLKFFNLTTRVTYRHGARPKAAADWRSSAPNC